ncbi:MULTISPECIES: BolA family protein [Deefgea]|uniref:BolA family transcriptional regulator n=1 Tax=Deefgea piscis TaxID=2739061 RepID=A0A6M8T052_9NEIS|nr:MULTISPECIES: BolA family protein [Deefgea]MBM5574062.1 BolA/IbaG family iron-sulfur metabolism protein [Deefgea sp. CFH1-16]QKJ68099.1 BolA family transcriptional regulator [Deefgea piscis]QZA82621.1 BolA family transcriptional regulator [Deefgea piscis]
MMTPEQVQALIAQILPCEQLDVEGDGHHFYATIVSSRFEGLGLLARHRLINDGLKSYIDSGELHAISMRATLTPAEMAKR